jgi:carboxyl-terminal processing protease
MRRRVFLAGLCACLAFLPLLVGTAAVAQLPTTITISDPRGEVDGLMQQGLQLEQQRRWGEALTHYEEAVRQYPKDNSLQQRFDNARLHYDLERRYSDRSFCNLVAQMSPDRALNLYGQVLLKIESHYVDVPHWNELVDCGARGFAMALGEPTFIERNVPQRNRLAIDAFRQELSKLRGSRVVNNRNDAREMVAAAAQLAEQKLEIPQAVVVLEYLCGATNSLDPYSAYLTPDQLNDVYAQIEGNFVGLGVELKAQEGTLVIVRVITGSPAEEGGVRAGDRILAVDGQSTAALSTERAANLLQGVDGSVVALSLAAPGQQPRLLNIRRRVVEVPSIDQVSIVDRKFGVGYFKLTCFQKTTARDLDAALWKLHRDGMRSLVMDLRGNPGGLLVSAVEVADRFIDRGVIVSTRGRISQEDYTYSAHEQGKWRMPLVVIVDQDSASAAEIFAGAIRDHHRGTIVGVRSFGKGSVQGIFPLDETNAGMRLTTAKFYSPKGHPFSGIGVEPDVPLQRIRNPQRDAHVVAKPIDGQMPAAEEPKDNMLNAAVQVARRASQNLQATR